MPGTIGAADHLRRSARPADDRRHAVDLLLTLPAEERHASVGGPAAVPADKVFRLLARTKDVLMLEHEEGEQ